jgi:hypothetical protein
MERNSFNSNLKQGRSLDLWKYPLELLLGNSIWCGIKTASFGCHFVLFVFWFCCSFYLIDLLNSSCKHTFLCLPRQILAFFNAILYFSKKNKKWTHCKEIETASASIFPKPRYKMH